LLKPWHCVLQLFDDGGEDDDEGDDGTVSYREWQLPATDFEGSWDALYYDSSIKRHLLQYASSALLFADHGVQQPAHQLEQVLIATTYILSALTVDAGPQQPVVGSVPP